MEFNPGKNYPPPPTPINMNGFNPIGTNTNKKSFQEDHNQG